MTQNMFRRFSGFEIIYHWCQGITYIALFLTGGLILIQRILDLELIPNSTLSHTHKITGGVFIAVMFTIIINSFFTNNFSALSGNLKESLKWNISDVLWLAKIPFNTVMPRRFPLPEMGRFNPGQKLHLLFITMAVPCFIISGILMIIVPGALGPWIIHSCLSVPAAGFITIHLYLSLINPPTRQAFKGIINGLVSEDYIRDHHPLCIEGAIEKHQGSVIWAPAIVMTIIATALLVSILVFLYDPSRLASRLNTIVKHRGADLIMPGGLCTSHIETWTSGRCFSCHRLLVSPPSEACLSCHAKIAEIIQNKIGHHGTFTGECRTCHPDHLGRGAEIRPLDKISFNHKQARFDLKGQHRDVKCEKCHLRDDRKNKRRLNRFTGIEFNECSNCHKDPHNRQMRLTCDKCHTENGWKDNFLIFSHSEHSVFKIDALHSKFSCSSCHKERKIVQYRPLAVTCKGCHSDTDLHMRGIAHSMHGKPDPHYGRVACIKCHPTDKSVIKQSDYAQKCISCHNKHYERLYLSWQKALTSSEIKAQIKLKELRNSGDRDVEDFEKKIMEAKSVGLHNVLFASELWKILLEER